jgi:hypothetical protein
VLNLHEVEVRLQLETRGLAHADGLVATLTERGYRIES